MQPIAPQADLLPAVLGKGLFKTTRFRWSLSGGSCLGNTPQCIALPHLWQKAQFHVLFHFKSHHPQIFASIQLDWLAHWWWCQVLVTPHNLPETFQQEHAHRTKAFHLKGSFCAFVRHHVGKGPAQELIEPRFHPRGWRRRNLQTSSAAFHRL